MADDNTHTFLFLSLFHHSFFPGSQSQDHSSHAPVRLVFTCSLVWSGRESERVSQWSDCGTSLFPSAPSQTLMPITY